MTALESLVVGILVAVLVWLIKSVIGLMLRRKAIKDALLLDIRSRINSWETNKSFLDGLIDNELRLGRKVPYTAMFRQSKTTLFDALLSEIITHLPDHFPNISKMYSAFKEAEDLLAGILRDMTLWKEQNHLLDESDIKYLRAKRDRIVSYVQIFKRKEIKGLQDLPVDYRGIQGTEAITGTIPNE